VDHTGSLAIREGRDLFRLDRSLIEECAYRALDGLGDGCRHFRRDLAFTSIPSQVAAQTSLTLEETVKRA